MIMLVRHPLLWLAVTDLDALASCPRRERYKQSTLGGFVLSSSLLAAIGAFGTARELGQPAPIALLAGLAAGAIIMNFDRHVIAALRRQQRPWETVLHASPRLLFALAAGQVVTMVFLIFLFSGEINGQVGIDRQNALNAAQALIDAQNAGIGKLVSKQNALEAAVTTVNSGKVLQTDPQYRQLLTQYQSLSDRAAAAQQAALCELDGTCGTRHAGDGPDYVAKKAVADQLTGEANAVKSQLAALAPSLLSRESVATSQRDTFDRAQINELGTELKQARARKAEQEKKLIKVTQAYDGPLARWDALSELAHKHASMRSFKFWLWLTLLLLDTSPALMKLMQLLGRPGVYEQVLEAADRRVVAQLDAEREADDVTAAVAAEERKQKRQSSIDLTRYETERAVETAKKRIDLAAETERDADRLLDAGQRARNARNVDEWNELLDQVAPVANARDIDRYLEKLAEDEDRAASGPWANGTVGPDLRSTVRSILDERLRSHGAVN